MRSTSGRARSSHQRTLSIRALSEFTFQVAMRTTAGYPTGRRSRASPEVECPTMTMTPAGPDRVSLPKSLTPEQRRVLGVLIEKAKTTPAGYPMTVNAIVAGCNQKNNREPITAYDDFD